MADPVTLGLSLAATAAGTYLSAKSTLAGGYAAQRGANFEADQDKQNATQEIASGQRRMFDKQLQTNLLESTITARAAGSGVNAAVGSPLEDVKQVASRGEYQAMMDMFSGESTATGLQNRAKGVIYTGDAALKGSKLAAAGTIANGFATAMRTYGAYQYPSTSGKPGAGYG